MKARLSYVNELGGKPVVNVAHMNASGPGTGGICMSVSTGTPTPCSAWNGLLSLGIVLFVIHTRKEPSPIQRWKWLPSYLRGWSWSTLQQQGIARHYSTVTTSQPTPGRQDVSEIKNYDSSRPRPCTPPKNLSGCTNIHVKEWQLRGHDS